MPGMPTEALCDTGADARLLVSPSTARRVAKLPGSRLRRLKKPICLTDYRAQPAGSVTHTLRTSLEICGRRFPNETFWVTESGHDIFVGEDWLVEHDVWLHPRTRTIKWPENDTPTDEPAEEPFDESMDEPLTEELQTCSIATLHQQVKQDPRQERWRNQRMPTKPMLLETTLAPPGINIAALSQNPAWKTNKGEPIPFPPDEDPDYVKLVRERLPTRLKHLEGFFSKKASTKLPPHRPGRDVVLELKIPRTGSPPTFRTPVSLIPLEKETINELLRSGFIKRSMEPKPASVLFAPKPHSAEKRFCIDYRWVN